MGKRSFCFATIPDVALSLKTNPGCRLLSTGVRYPVVKDGFSDQAPAWPASHPMLWVCITQSLQGSPGVPVVSDIPRMCWEERVEAPRRPIGQSTAGLGELSKMMGSTYLRTSVCNIPLERTESAILSAILFNAAYVDHSSLGPQG